MTDPAIRPATSAALRAISNAFASPGAWCQGAAAKNADGQRVSPGAPSAVCHCLMGLISQIQPPAVGVAVEDELIITIGPAAPEVLDGREVAAWNDADGRTHAEVLEAIDKTIARVEAETCSTCA
jgi:hypothetical protein